MQYMLDKSLIGSLYATDENFPFTKQFIISSREDLKGYRQTGALAVLEGLFDFYQSLPDKSAKMDGGINTCFGYVWEGIMKGRMDDARQSIYTIEKMLHMDKAARKGLSELDQRMPASWSGASKDILGERMAKNFSSYQCYAKIAEKAVETTDGEFKKSSRSK